MVPVTPPLPSPPETPTPQCSKTNSLWFVKIISLIKKKGGKKGGRENLPISFVYEKEKKIGTLPSIGPFCSNPPPPAPASQDHREAQSIQGDPGTETWHLPT